MENFDILTILTIIAEGLQIGDIATTEYGLHTKIVEESNPLMKNNNLRRFIGYPVKLTLPLLLKFFSTHFPKYYLAFVIGQSVNIGMYTAVIASNLYQIFLKGKK